MTDLYLIAHKVHGQPAFDVASRMQCPECIDDNGCYNDGCSQCDDTGFWWIIPTSGHRAYPWWFADLEHFWENSSALEMKDVATNMPPDLPDHYPTRAAPTISLAERLGIGKAKAGVQSAGPFPRRL